MIGAPVACRPGRRPRRPGHAMINVAAMVSPRNLPMMAEYGWSLIFFVPPGGGAVPGAGVARHRRARGYLAAARRRLPLGEGGLPRRAGFLAVWCDWARTSPGSRPCSRSRRELRLRARPRPGQQQGLPRRRVLAVFWGATLAASGHRRDQRHRGDRHRARGHRAGAPDHGAGVAFLVDGNDSEIPFSDALIPNLGVTTWSS